MENQCTHTYEVKYDALAVARFVCTKCGDKKCLRGKYAKIIYLLGLIGWIPSLFLDYAELSSVWRFILSIASYMLFNAVLYFAFYKWLKTKKSTHLDEFMDK